MSVNKDYNSPYSPHKLFHHWDKIKELRDGKQTVPLQVQLIISDLCSHDCSFCAYRQSGYTSNELFGIIDKNGDINNNPNRMIPYNKVLEIVDDCAELGVKAIQLTGGGEPSVHPKHPEIYHYILDKGLDVGLVSHGNILRPKALEAMMRPNFQWVRISVDAGTKESYGSIRRINPSNFDVTLNNIRTIVEQKKRHNPDLVVGIGFVVTEDNWKEVVTCAEIVKEIGVDNLRISAIFTQEDIKYFEEFWDEANELCKQAKKLETPTFKVFNLFDDRSDDLKLKNPDYKFCSYQQLNTYIGGDLNVYRCCNLAYSTRGTLGSLVNQRFKDFWLSQEKEEKISNFNAKQCKLCMFNQKNLIALYAIEPNPKHVNFV
jgi:MoaA/NifB/PqqE/SkfB family radical SAM enzyme